MATSRSPEPLKPVGPAVEALIVVSVLVLLPLMIFVALTNPLLIWALVGLYVVAQIVRHFVRWLRS